LLWIDADMQWEPSAIDLLLEAADPKDRPIVGGLAFGMALDGMYPTIYQWAEIDGKLTTIRVRDYPTDSVIPVAATGAAFLLIHRRALQQMAAKNFDPAFPFFAESAGNGKPVGEDITFCVRAGICGLPVAVHTGARIGHHKSALLTEEQFFKQLPAGLPPGIGLVIPTRGDHPELLRAIVATSGLPADRVVIIDTHGSNGNGMDAGSVKQWATVITDTGEVNIHRWWNAGINLLAERGCDRVAVLNDDLVIAPDTLPKMARALGSATLAVTGNEDGTTLGAGHCWMLNVGHGVRPDESFRWWCGDLQLWADAERAGGVVRVPEAWCLHLHANEATDASPDLQALAEADGALYDSRHPAGTVNARIPEKEPPR
jgi:GT2 family glycosyltransferase